MTGNEYRPVTSTETTNSTKTTNVKEQLPSREELEKDLTYLFSLGLTEKSGNETLNDRLAKWKALTGEEYNPSKITRNTNSKNYTISAEGGGKKSRKTKQTKRKYRKARKSRN